MLAWTTVPSGVTSSAPNEIVAGQAVLRCQVPEPATEREAADARGADHATRRHEAERLHRRVEVEPGRPAFGAGDPRFAVHLDAAHPREVDHEPAVEDAVPCGVVPAAAHGDLEGVRTREVEGGRDVG